MKSGNVSSAYLDDMYLQGKTYRECVDNVFDSVQVVDSLGFVAHPDKSLRNGSNFWVSY